MTDFTFGDVLRFNALTRNELKRWTQVGLIRPAVVPGENLRRFSARNVVEAGVVDELRGFGLPEAHLTRVVEALNNYWDYPDTRINERQDAPTHRDCPLLWIAAVRVTLPPDDEVHESLLIRFVDVPTLTRLLTTDDSEAAVLGEQTGIVVPLDRIIARLERAAGAHFDFTRPVAAAGPAVPRVDPRQELAALRQEFEHVHAALAAKFTEALTAALTAATVDETLSEKKRAAILSAVTAAFAEQQP